MRDETGLPDDPTTGGVGEAVSVELPLEETPSVDAGLDLGPTHEAVAALEATGGPTRGRWFPETIGGVLYLVMLVAAAVALAVVMTGEWRTGIRVFAGVLFAGATFRLVLPPARAGMLAVRSRPIDVLMYLVAGGVLIFLAGSIPDQPV